VSITVYWQWTRCVHDRRQTDDKRCRMRIIA